MLPAKKHVRLRCAGMDVMGFRKPDFLGIGVQKGGTTTLHALLDQHPGVMLPSRKELQYFSLHFNLGQAWYCSQFASANSSQLLGEITPYYSFHPLAPQRIWSLCPEVKLILLFRDPVDRTLSHLFHSYRLGLESLPPIEALQAETARLLYSTKKVLRGELNQSHQEHSYTSRSCYEVQLSRYEAFFPKEQILILRSEDLFCNPEHTWKDVQNFLELDHINLPYMPRANAGNNEANLIPKSLRESLRFKFRNTYQQMENMYNITWDTD